MTPATTAAPRNTVDAVAFYPSFKNWAEGLWAASLSKSGKGYSA